METAKPGVPVGAIDDAVRAYYEKEGWGPGYRLPGLPHRTGHGSVSTGTSRPTSCTAIQPRSRPHVFFRTSPDSIFPANSASAWKTAGI